MSLPILVAQDKWQEFDEAWNELMTSDDAEVDDLLTALKLAGDKKRIARCLPLVRQHVEVLETAGRHAEAARVLGAALVAGGPPTELVGPLMENARKAWADESWWPVFSEVAGIEEDGTDLRRSWASFDRLHSFHVGGFVYHPGGWGTGAVTGIDQGAREIQVRFQSGRTDSFPMSAAVDIFEPLDAGDLRAQSCRDADDLKKRLKKEHLEMLRAVLLRHHGRATLAAIKNALAQVGIEGSAWTAWWRKARKLAENDAWFRVSGNGSRMEVRLLLEAADTVAQLERQLEEFTGVGELVARVRELFSAGVLDAELEPVALARVEERAADEDEPTSERVAAWLLLRERRGETPPALAETLRAAAEQPDPEDPTALPELYEIFHALPSLREQELALDLLPEIHGESWLDRALDHFQHAAPGQVRPLADRAYAAKRGAELARHYAELLARPLRSPHALVVLAKLAEKGKLKGDFPPPVQRAQSLIMLAVHLYDEKRANPGIARIHTRLVDLLTSGREPVLEQMLDGADERSLRSVQLLLQRGVEEAIDNLVGSLVFHAGAANEENAQRFWEGDAIWTTRSGLARRRAELRELTDEKMPANEEAIGRAAAMGDLSENAEWEAAMEEKRNLSARAAQIRGELSNTALLEDASLPEDTVCPGTIVRYVEDSKASDPNQVVILGPWDTSDEGHVISYRAPLAQGLLGMHTGERKRIELPSGAVEVEVLEISQAAID